MAPLTTFATDPDLSKLNGHFLPQQLWALGAILLALPLIWLAVTLIVRIPPIKRVLAKRAAMRREPVVGLPSPIEKPDLLKNVPDASLTGYDAPPVVGRPARLAVFVGADGRVSTSRTIALLWTVVVGYCLFAIVLIATTRPSGANPLPPGHIPTGFINPALKSLLPQYLVLLGAPFAAAVGAKIAVTTKLKSGMLQKPANIGTASPLDLVTDDSGNLDLVDLQYTLFNVIAAVYVLTQFVPHPGRGIPTIPATLALLTGASAAGYTTNKAAAKNPPKITTVVPPTAAPGSPVTIHGHDLAVNTNTQDAKALIAATTVTLIPDPLPPSSAAAAPLPGVSVSTHPGSLTSDRIKFTVPPGTRPGHYSVSVVTNGGKVAGIVQDGGITVIAGKEEASEESQHNAVPP